MKLKKKKKKKKKKETSIIKFWRLKSVAGQLSDRLKIFAGQNENFPVLSDSPAVFAKTDYQRAQKTKLFRPDGCYSTDIFSNVTLLT